MIVDLEEVGGGSYEADVCVIGGGAAGITVARALATSGISTVLVEGGGLTPEATSQQLYRGEVTGRPYSLETSRLRYFGGSTGHWEGYCGPLDASDFRPRGWVPYSGWPIDHQELLPYWTEAHEILDLGPFLYDVPGRERRTGEFKWLRPCLWRHSPPTRFKEKYEDDVRRSDVITCLLHANLLRLQGTNGGRVARQALVGALGGALATVRAHTFVLACGGIENARVLLLAAHRGDLALDQVEAVTGRFFMEHVLVGKTATVLANGDWWRDFERFSHEGFDVTPGLRLSEKTQQDHELLSLGGMMRPTECPAGPLAGRTCLAFLTVAEQAPDPGSLVTLGSRHDAFGLPLAKLHWRLGDLDRRTIDVGSRLLAHEIGRLRLGRTRLEDMLSPAAADSFWSANHHIGTTRMADDGVVDPDCRVHGIENLFVAGSSVFPTGGYVNPTLTIVALALRLADHIAKRL
jgi:glycine/D-amino acid oxidase-like deaminating enzyme